MRGKGIDQDQLYQGTAKGAEGHAADIAFGQGKENRSAMARWRLIFIKGL